MWNLSDILNDSYERANLYEQIEYQEVIKELKFEMQRFRLDWDDEKHSLNKKYWDQYNEF